MRPATALPLLRPVARGALRSAGARSHAMLSTEADVQRISAVGILADVGFGCTKLGVGTACASPAVVADGAHSLADVLVGAVSYGALAAA